MIFRGLKMKMFSVYTILILLIFGVSLSFIINLTSLGRTINEFMQANYKSIEASQNMMNALDDSQEAVLTYIIRDENTGNANFMKSAQYFMSSFAAAEGNITEKGESDTVKNIGSSFDEYYNSYTNLQGYKKGHDTSEVMKFYNDTLMKQYMAVKSNCRALLKLNENAMFASKNNATENAHNSIYTNLIVSIIAIIFGFALILYVLISIFKPLRQLTNSVKSIVEGNLDHEIHVKTSDEIGELAREFNSMTRRLQHYDQINIKKLVDEKNKSIAIVNSISDPIIVTDIDCKVILLNPAFESLFETEQLTAIGKHLLDIISNKTIYDAVSDATANKIINNDADTISVNVNNKDFYYRISATPILGKDCGINGAVTILQDITHMKEVEQLKSEFVSTVSHEFRTPLTSISLGAGLLLDGTLGEISDSQKEIISAIRDEEMRLANLVNDLLDLSRIESGKMAVNMKPCSSEDIIDITIKSLSEQAKIKNISLGCYIDEELPEVKADPEKLKIVLTNLIGNAIKFTPTDGKIEVFAHHHNKKVYISVKDSGIGIPKEYHNKIFEKFIQVKKDINDGVGTGLGLTISKKIVEIHGGEIWVESEEGRGSTFTFTLKTAQNI